MKRFLALLMIFALLFSCAAADAPTAGDALQLLRDGNAAYLLQEDDKASAAERADTAANGQHPYAVVITCSDSRVPAELIFDAGIGELFVIRTAGNVIGSYELGSIEYGAEHLHAPLVIVLGHTGCGAVAAALEGGAHGHIADIVSEISACLPQDCDAAQAEILNVDNSLARIRTSHIMQELEAAGQVTLVGAIYDIATGEVTFR